jgi:uncharacterized protein YidB (DUF937 family)
MANPLLGQILGGVFANAMRGRARSGPFGNAPGMSARGGGLGDLLGGMMGRGMPMGRTGGLGGNRGMLLAMLLPYAMQWVQRNGGVGAVLEKFRNKGFGAQAQSWVSTGANQAIQADDVNNVIGRDELSQLSRQLGVPEREVADGFGEILPEVVDKLSPEGEVPPEADDALNAGLSELEKALHELQTGITA